MIDGILRAYCTSGNGDGSLTTTQEVISHRRWLVRGSNVSIRVKVTACFPQFSVSVYRAADKRFTVACRIVVVRTTGIVTLTHRAHITTAIDIDHDMTTTHGDRRVAIDLS